MTGKHYKTNIYDTQILWCVYLILNCYFCSSTSSTSSNDRAENMTQATTLYQIKQQYDRHTPIASCQALIQLLYLKYNCCMESYTPPPVDPARIPHLSLCVNFQSFFSFWTACDTTSIEIDTTEQQVARHNQPNTYIRTTIRQQNTQLRSNIQDIGRNHQYYL